MSVHAPLIPELEEVIRRSSPARRTRALERITAFFVNGASRFSDDQVRLFDPVFSRLLSETETPARSELSHRLAPLANAPLEAVRRLAYDDDIAVAGVILRQSRRLAEPELVDIAERMGQAHLLAIAARADVTESVTDVLVRRGDCTVLRRLAENRGARLSHDALVVLIERAETDSALAEKIGLRSDLARRLLRDLLLKTTDAVRQRLLPTAAPEIHSEIRGVLANVAGAGRDYALARRTVEALRREGKLGPAAIVDFANNQQYDEAVAALAALCIVPIEVVDRLMAAEWPDPMLILCKSAGWDWPIAEAIITLRPRGRGMSAGSLDAAHDNFERLSPMTAQRVLRFWQASSDDGEQTPVDVAPKS
jgi:uncharacterized protein (DUF2336 family)